MTCLYRSNQCAGGRAGGQAFCVPVSDGVTPHQMRRRQPPVVGTRCVCVHLLYLSLVLFSLAFSIASLPAASFSAIYLTLLLALPSRRGPGPFATSYRRKKRLKDRREERRSRSVWLSFQELRRRLEKALVLHESRTRLTRGNRFWPGWPDSDFS